MIVGVINDFGKMGRGVSVGWNIGVYMKICRVKFEILVLNFFFCSLLVLDDNSCLSSEVGEFFLD